MSPVFALDMIAFFGAAGALVTLGRGWRRALRPEARALLGCLLTFSLLYSVCLIVEWSGMTNSLDKLEDVIGALTPMAWAFVFYALLMGVAQAELKESEARLHELFDLAPVGYHEIDTAGRVARVNRTEAEMLGYGPEEMLGRPIWEFMDDSEAARRSVLDKLAERKPPGRAFERALRRKNGALMTVLIEDRLLRDETGKTIGIRSTMEDITARKRIEEALALERRLMDALMDTIPDHIYFKDGESRFLRISSSQARRFGLASSREGEGKTDFDFFSREHAEQAFADEERVMRSGEALVSFDERETWPDGTESWVSTTKAPLRDGEGRIVGVFGVSRDVTSRKQVEAEREALLVELEAKNTELEQFTYAVSHDLKAPLITIRGFLGLMEKDAEAGNVERMADDVARINAAAEKMGRLLDELLALSRIGRLDNPPREIRLAELASEASELVAGRIATRGARVEIGGDLPTFVGDEPRFLQVLQNLVDNAVKFMGDQPEPVIEIGARRENGETVCFVRDNGMGIEPRYHKRVFRLFDQLDQGNEGSGVGLVVVKRVIERHGGRVWVESAGRGKGCAVCFTVPLKAKGEPTRHGD